MAEVEHAHGGRLLRVGWPAAEGQRWSALAVYAPCEAAARPAFFEGPYVAALEAGPVDSMLIAAGDFNCAMAAEDVLPEPGQRPEASRRLVGASVVRRVHGETGLQDVWRAAHPAAAQPTHYSVVPARRADGQQPSGGRGPSGGALAGGRIDYIFAARPLVDAGWVRKAWQQPRYPSDHRPVCALLVPPCAPAPAGPRWRFPASLLGDEEAVEELRGELAVFADSRAVWMEQRPHAGLPAFWQALKEHAANVARAIMGRRRFARALALRGLRREVAAARGLLRRTACAEARRALLQAEERLEAALAARRAEAGRAAAALWDVYGESATRWFHRHGRPPPQQQVIEALVAPDGTRVRAAQRGGNARIGDVLADFFDPAAGGLYAPAEVDRQRQVDLLAAVGARLSPAAAAQCRGPRPDGALTLAEAKSALDSLPRGRAAGPDGLPYEFLSAFWPEVGSSMVDALNAVFLAPGEPCLPRAQRQGLITLLRKPGKPHDEPGSYRPITLLDADVKVAAKAQARRWGHALAGVIDPCQSAFVPGRDIADNILAHLELVDCLQATQRPGCVVLLDFQQAYDRVDRGWLLACMRRLGMPPQAVRWAQLLLAGSEARVVYNAGHQSRTFRVDAGCAQGSPLSPLLYVIAAQPLAAMCGRLQAAGRFAGISVPGAPNMPCCWQHADDTTLHAASAADAAVLLREAVMPFCAASGARLNVGKCQGIALGSHPPIAGVDPATGVTFVDSAQRPVRHLGVPLTTAPAGAGRACHVALQRRAAEELFVRRLAAVTHSVRQWARYDLTRLGRVEVARQVLTAALCFHAQFLPVPGDVAARLQWRIDAFVRGGACPGELQRRAAPVGSPSRCVPPNNSHHNSQQNSPTEPRVRI